MAPRKISDRELSELFRFSTRADLDRAGCPDSKSFHRAATRRLTYEELDRLVEHLGRCSTCAQEYRAVRTLEPWREELERSAGADRIVEPPSMTPSPVWIAVAAMLVVILGLAGWSGVLWNRNRQLAGDLDRARTVRAVTTTAESETRRLRGQIGELQQTVARLTAPQIDVPVIDLDFDDQSRGPADTKATVVSLSPGGTSFTVILTLPDQTAGNLMVDLKKDGEPVWSESWRRSRNEQSVAVTLTRAGLPAGTYRFEIRRRPGDTPLAVYPMRVIYE